MAGYDTCLQRFYYGVETSMFGRNEDKGQTRIYTGKDNGAKKLIHVYSMCCWDIENWVSNLMINTSFLPPNNVSMQANPHFSSSIAVLVNHQFSYSVAVFAFLEFIYSIAGLANLLFSCSIAVLANHQFNYSIVELTNYLFVSL